MKRKDFNVSFALVLFATSATFKAADEIKHLVKEAIMKKYGLKDREPAYGIEKDDRYRVITESG